MVYVGFKQSDPDIEEWLNTKKNKSLIIKQALKEKYLKEKEEEMKSKTPQKVVMEL